jgi:hypothetical protein
VIEGPRRVTTATGQPQKREEQRQALITHNFPVERTDGGETYRYRLTSPLVLVTFDVDDSGAKYVANTVKTIRVKLGHKPTGFSKNWCTPPSGTGVVISENTSILVYPVNRENWTPSQIQVACNIGVPAEPPPDYAAVQAELEVY